MDGSGVGAVTNTARLQEAKVAQDAWLSDRLTRKADSPCGEAAARMRKPQTRSGESAISDSYFDAFLNDTINY